jgi:hypothetical protein
MVKRMVESAHLVENGEIISVWSKFPPPVIHSRQPHAVAWDVMFLLASKLMSWHSASNLHFSEERHVSPV